jgi:hypothetical protein
MDDVSLGQTLMEKELLKFLLGPELDATLQRLSEMFGRSREELAHVLLEEAAFAVEDMYERSGQIWDSIRFDYIHGGRRSIRRRKREGAIDEILRKADEMSRD